MGGNTPYKVQYVDFPHVDVPLYVETLYILLYTPTLLTPPLIGQQDNPPPPPPSENQKHSDHILIRKSLSSVNQNFLTFP